MKNLSDTLEYDGSPAHKTYTRLPPVQSLESEDCDGIGTASDTA